jgi:hypothetical protein
MIPEEELHYLKLISETPYRYKHRTEYFLAAEGTYSGQYIFLWP